MTVVRRAIFLDSRELGYGIVRKEIPLDQLMETQTTMERTMYCTELHDGSFIYVGGVRGDGTLTVYHLHVEDTDLPPLGGG